MGCCASTGAAAPPANTPHDGGSKSPPPVDEETVKELLSETKRSSPAVLRFESGGAAAFRSPRLGSPTFLEEVRREKAAARSPAAGESSRSVTCSGPGSPETETGFRGSKSSRRNGNYSGWIGFGSGKMIRNGDGKEREELARPPTRNEMLENSLVSLECFIFL